MSSEKTYIFSAIRCEATASGQRTGRCSSTWVRVMVDIMARKAGLEDVLGYFDDGGNRYSFPTEETKATISTPPEYISGSALLY